jgi:hypothetical protein
MGSGASYVVFGKNTGFAATFDLATLSAPTAFGLTVPPPRGGE